MKDGQSQSVGQNSIYRDMLHGSAWALLLPWVERLIGVVSIAVLARLLSPADFGIMAMGALVVGLVDRFSDFGVTTLIIREKDTSHDFYNTGWTVKLLQGFLIGIVLVFLAPVASNYFDEPRLTSVIYVLALVAAIGGIENLAVVLWQKNLEFSQDFRFAVYRRLFRTIAVVLTAFVLRSYWALVFGALIGTVLTVALSYRMHAYRPRLNFKGIWRFLRFAFHNVQITIGRYIQEKCDLLVIGRLFDTATLGLYSMAGEVANMGVVRMVGPISRAMVPTYARISDDREQLKEAYLYSFSAEMMLYLSLGVGLALVANDAVLVLLGSQWSSTGPLLQWLALYGMVIGVTRALSGRLLMVTGHERTLVWFVWTRLVVLVPAVIGAASLVGVEAVPIAATLSAALFLPVAAWQIQRVIDIQRSELLRVGFRPIVAVVAMTGAVTALHLHDVHPALALLGDITVGGCTFTLTIFAVWGLSGKPRGPEAALVSLLISKVLRRSPAL